MKEFFLYAIKNNWGDIASLLGLLVSIFGFIFTIKTAVKSRRAAEAAVREVKSNLRRSDTVAEFGSFITQMDEIKKTHRSKDLNYELLLERYSILRKGLINTKESNHLLTKNDHVRMQDTITQISSLEKVIDDEISRNKDQEEIRESIRAPRFNKLIGQNMDELQAILIRVKNETEIRND